MNLIQFNVQAQVFVCLPVSRAWDIEALPGNCFNGPLFMIMSGAINVATDVILLLFPLPLLRVLKFNRRQRSTYPPFPFNRGNQE